MHYILGVQEFAETAMTHCWSVADCTVGSEAVEGIVKLAAAGSIAATTVV